MHAQEHLPEHAPIRTHTCAHNPLLCCAWAPTLEQAREDAREGHEGQVGAAKVREQWSGHGDEAPGRSREQDDLLAADPARGTKGRPCGAMRPGCQDGLDQEILLRRGWGPQGAKHPETAECWPSPPQLRPRVFQSPHSVPRSPLSQPGLGGAGITDPPGGRPPPESGSSPRRSC